MRTDFQNIDNIRDDEGTLIVRWKGQPKMDLLIGHEKDNFMKPYRIWLSQQQSPDDRICDLDRIDGDGNWSRDVEMENMRSMMDAGEKDKHTRMQDNFDGVFHLMEAVTQLQEESQAYIANIAKFQKNTIKALQDSESFLMHENVSKWELKRFKAIVNATTECREVGKKINAIALQILEDWII